MRIRSRLLMSVAAAAVVAAGVLACMAYVAQRGTATLQAQKDSQDIARSVASLLALSQEYTVYGSERTSTQWRARYAQLVRTVERTVENSAAPHPALLEMRQHVLDLAPLYDGLEQAFRSTGSDLAQRRRGLMVERLVSESQELVEARFRWASAIGDEQARDQRWYASITVAAPGILLLLIVALALLVWRRMLVPLESLQAATAAIQRGDLAVRCDTTVDDELGDTGRAVNAMAESLLESNRSLHDEVEHRRDAEQRLRNVMEASPLGMFVGNAQGEFLYTNSAWQNISGLTAQQALGTGARAVLHTEDRERVLLAWATAVAAGTPQVGEHRYRRPDGSVVWVRRHTAPMRLEDGTPGVVCTVEDITEQRRLDQLLAARTADLARSNDELERFAYVASHDLQEPLRMVTSYSQLLVRRHRAQLGAEAQEFLAFVLDGGQRAQALISDLLRLARVESQAQPMQAVNLEALLADVLVPLQSRICEAGARVSHDALPTVTADPRQMGQLLQNLIGNALKFRAATAPAIHLDAVRAGNGWSIAVRDNGIGIEPRFHERIFVLFQRLHARSDYEGTGIGLAICKKVVERHGGSLRVESAPGKGAAFHFTLPDREPAPPPQPAAAWLVRT